MGEAGTVPMTCGRVIGGTWRDDLAYSGKGPLESTVRPI